MHNNLPLAFLIFMFGYLLRWEVLNPRVIVMGYGKMRGVLVDRSFRHIKLSRATKYIFMCAFPLKWTSEIGSCQGSATSRNCKPVNCLRTPKTLERQLPRGMGYFNYLIALSHVPLASRTICPKEWRGGEWGPAEKSGDTPQGAELRGAGPQPPDPGAKERAMKIRTKL